MIIIMPIAAKKWNWFQSLTAVNKNIRFFYVNQTVVNRGCSQWLKNFLFSRNLAMPCIQTVLIAMVFLGINMGYKKIFLVGADHSMHENIFVGNDNIVYEQIAHFYVEDNIKPRPFLMSPDGLKRFKLHELFQAFALMFEGHHENAAYADFAGTKIYNASSKSYIDAYERRSL